MSLQESRKCHYPILDSSHTAAAHMHESGMFELVDTGNQQSNKEFDWQKVFYVF